MISINFIYLPGPEDFVFLLHMPNAIYHKHLNNYEEHITLHWVSLVTASAATEALNLSAGHGELQALGVHHP